MWLFVGAVTLVGVTAFLARLPSIDPLTLWYDDVWVAAIATAESWTQAVTTRAPAPPGHMLLLRASAVLISDPEIALQSVALVSGLIGIPLVGWIVVRLTGNWFAGIATVGFVALDPRLTERTVQVKHYAVEFMLVALLLAAFVATLDGRGRGSRPPGDVPSSRSWMVWLPLAAIAVLPMMVSGNIAAVLLVDALVAVVAWRHGRMRWKVLATGAVFNAAAALMAIFVYLPRRTAWLGRFWDRHFVPSSSWTEAGGYLASTALGSLTDAAPKGLPWLAVLIVPGLIAVFRERRTRPLGAFVLVLWSTMFVAGALGIHPVGSRADIFTEPVTLALMGVGLLALWQLPSLGAPGARLGMAASAAAVIVLAAVQPPRPVYFDSALSVRVRELFDTLRPRDGLIIYPESTWVVAFYSGRPIIFDNADLDETMQAVPVARIDRANTLSLPMTSPAAFRSRLDEFIVRGNFPRIFYFGSRMRRDVPERPVFRLLRQRGYGVQQDRRSMLNTPGARRQDAGVIVFVRQRGPFETIQFGSRRPPIPCTINMIALEKVPRKAPFQPWSDDCEHRGLPGPIRRPLAIDSTQASGESHAYCT